MGIMWTGIVSFVTVLQAVTNSAKETTFPMLMPNVQPKVVDTYFCTSFKLPHDNPTYIVGFQPNATMHTAHHILLYGCSTPGTWQRDSPRLVWNCGEMAQSKSSEASHPVCSAGSEIIYAWARDAPPLKLPEGVAFKVGKDTSVKFLVLQVHYAHVDKFVNGATDDSGIFLKIADPETNSITKRAGVYLLGTGGMISKKSTEKFETACTVKEDMTLIPFAFRTHTHQLGKLVTGYVIKPDGSWHNIGKHNPQEPQMFYPVKDKSLTVNKGDVLVGRCTMYNFHNHATSVGSTSDDEMCNFYMMYYVEGDKVLDEKYCFTSGPPYYYWRSDRQLPSYTQENDIDASTPE